MEIYAQQCPWYVAGPLLGLLVAGLLWAINKPLGALGGYVDAVQWFGARAGGGCTSGHGMCGMAMGSPASIVCTMTFMGAAVAAANLLALLVRGGS